MSFKVKCGLCNKEIILLKDSTEGLKVYHGECYEKVKHKLQEY